VRELSGHDQVVQRQLDLRLAAASPDRFAWHSMAAAERRPDRIQHGRFALSIAAHDRDHRAARSDAHHLDPLEILSYQFDHS
jgi:hypothetical protein